MRTDGKIICGSTALAIVTTVLRACFADVSFEEAYMVLTMGMVIIWSQLAIRDLERRLRA